MSDQARSVIDYDHHAPEYSVDRDRLDRELRDRCPVGWSESHGGFWVISEHAGLTAALRDRELCSNAKWLDDDGTPNAGVGIPTQGGPRLIPEEVDPPEWDAFRKIFNPVFAPPAVEAMRPRLEEITTAVIDSVIEKGQTDLLLDIGYPVTALTTMDILGLPASDWHFYAEPIHEIGYNPEPRVIEGLGRCFERLAEVVADRRQRQAAGYRPAPGEGDLIDRFIDSRIGGELIDDHDVCCMIYMIIIGGFDTTAALLANAMWHLDEHRDEHQRLIDDERFLKLATEEFARYSSPVSGLGRTVLKDFEIQGQKIRAGERLWINYKAANRDPKVFDNPDEIDMSRFPNRHVGWGMGIHRCLGSNLARAIFQIIVREVLTRMPDFAIDRANSHQVPDRSMINAWIDMPMTFTPGPRLASGEGLPV